MQTVPAGHGGVVQGILPLATVVAASIFAHERPSRGFWLASVAGAIGYAFSGRLATRMPGWEVISWQVVILLPVALLAAWALWPADQNSVSTAALVGLGYVGFISQYAAFVVFNAALAMGGIARIGQIMLLQPFVIVGLALPINGEPITVETIVFAIAVVVTVLIGQRARVGRSVPKF